MLMRMVVANSATIANRCRIPAVQFMRIDDVSLVVTALPSLRRLRHVVLPLVITSHDASLSESLRGT
jgi:hypothetical protein